MVVGSTDVDIYSYSTSVWSDGHKESGTLESATLQLSNVH